MDNCSCLIIVHIKANENGPMVYVILIALHSHGPQIQSSLSDVGNLVFICNRGYLYPSMFEGEILVVGCVVRVPSTWSKSYPVGSWLSILSHRCFLSGCT